MVKIDFNNFPTDESHAQIPGKLFIMDNLHAEVCVEQKKMKKSMFPVQVTMAVVFFCIKGRLSMNLDLKSVTMTENTVMIILPGSFFEITEYDPDSKVIMIAISPDFINISHDIILGIEFGHIMKEDPLHAFSQEEMDEIQSVIISLKKKLLNKDFLLKEDLAKAYISIFQCNIFNKVAYLLDQKKSYRPTNRKEEIFRDFIKLVRDNYKTNRNISFYSEKLFMSPKYLSTVIHDVSGKYATEWINSFVILEAKAMLRRSGTSVKNVTVSLHFANQSFFAKFFKQHTGHTPKEYMNM